MTVGKAEVRLTKEIVNNRKNTDGEKKICREKKRERIIEKK